MSSAVKVEKQTYRTASEAMKDYVSTRHKAIMAQIESLQAIDAELLNFRQFFECCSYTEDPPKVFDEGLRDLSFQDLYKLHHNVLRGFRERIQDLFGRLADDEAKEALILYLTTKGEG